MTGADSHIQPRQRILVLGAYGLIGYGIAKKLVAEGHAVTGLGRNMTTATRVLPELPWVERDMSALDDIDAWRGVLDGFSVVVNCSGALQDGAEDDLEAVHHHSVAALSQACAKSDIHLVQISAVGATLDASTPFLASKARGDHAIKTSGARYHLFRPGLVLAPNAYGGTALLRMVSAFPWVQPIAMPDAQIQSVALEDVACAVSAAIDGRLPDKFEVDLVEAETHSLRDVVASMRHWLGFQPARVEIALPAIAVRLVSKVADALAHLGWRSPLRSTAVQVLSDGVRGTPADLTAFGVPPISSLRRTLDRIPVGARDRLQARMALMTPLILFGLALFWLASGIVGLLRVSDAASVLEAAGWSEPLSIGSVVFWAFVDIAIGVAFAFRRYAPGACWAAVAVSVFYLGASTFVVPALWIDPLGPLVKIVPGILLALVARIALESR